MGFTVGLYFITFILLVLSFIKNKKKTKAALKKAWKSFEKMLPQFIVILLLVGFLLSLFSPEQISKVIGKQSGWVGMMISGIIGSITLIPGMISFPLAATLLHNGAGIAQVAMFISTLMMVGIITFPLESSIFTKKIAFKRNISAFLAATIISLLMGVFL